MSAWTSRDREVREAGELEPDLAEARSEPEEDDGLRGPDECERRAGQDSGEADCAEGEPESEHEAAQIAVRHGRGTGQAETATYTPRRDEEGDALARPVE